VSTRIEFRPLAAMTKCLEAASWVTECDRRLRRGAQRGFDMRCWQIAASFRLGAPELDDLRAAACQW
jgi:hypothetical protein